MIPWLTESWRQNTMFDKCLSDSSLKSSPSSPPATKDPSTPPSGSSESLQLVADYFAKDSDTKSESCKSCSKYDAAQDCCMRSDEKDKPQKLEAERLRLSSILYKKQIRLKTFLGATCPIMIPSEVYMVVSTLQESGRLPILSGLLFFSSRHETKEMVLLQHLQLSFVDNGSLQPDELFASLVSESQPDEIEWEDAYTEKGNLEVDETFQTLARGQEDEEIDWEDDGHAVVKATTITEDEERFLDAEDRAAQQRINEERENLLQEEAELRAEKKRNERNAETVTNEMFAECQDAESDLGLNQDKLIRMAMLHGSDYTQGIRNCEYYRGCECLSWRGWAAKA
ncbi:hypothetical protein SELMODRAFT_408336 [Selaginella moellendorffii]|uniref:Uncharacterized protein n=1 Tax=Selaginella moellendorffii TaxID=88036 RepID=D8R7Z1_SELML|nr:hypothetical protein SELMODRAFT_408336 [Selaginella moellendorffii]